MSHRAWRFLGGIHPRKNLDLDSAEWAIITPFNRSDIWNVWTLLDKTLKPQNGLNHIRTYLSLFPHGNRDLFAHACTNRNGWSRPSLVRWTVKFELEQTQFNTSINTIGYLPQSSHLQSPSALWNPGVFHGFPHGSPSPPGFPSWPPCSAASTPWMHRGQMSSWGSWRARRLRRRCGWRNVTWWFVPVSKCV